jgi:hypothetical protein
MLSVTYKPLMLSVIMLNVIMLNVIILSIIMLNVIMLSVVMLNVVAPNPRVLSLNVGKSELFIQTNSQSYNYIILRTEHDRHTCSRG